MSEQLPKDERFGSTSIEETCSDLTQQAFECAAKGWAMSAETYRAAVHFIRQGQQYKFQAEQNAQTVIRQANEIRRLEHDIARALQNHSNDLTEMLRP